MLKRYLVAEHSMAQSPADSERCETKEETDNNSDIAYPIELLDERTTEERVLSLARPEQWVQLYLLKMIPDLKVDWIGNMYLINPWTPLVCAHMDSLASAQEKTLHKIQVYEGDRVQGKGIIWCDDKCGIAVALRLRDYFKKNNGISFLFTVWEESGWEGSAYFVKTKPDLLKQCLYAIIPDRMWAHDVIANSNDYCWEEFEDALMKWLTPFGFKPTYWVRCDADKLNSILNCFNISVGYMWHHTASEHCFLSQMGNTAMALKNLIENFTDTAHPLPTPRKYGNYHSTLYGDEYDSYGGMPDTMPTIEQYTNGEVYVTENLSMMNLTTGETVQLSKWDWQIITWYEDGVGYIDSPTPDHLYSNNPYDDNDCPRERNY